MKRDHKEVKRREAFHSPLIAEEQHQLKSHIKIVSHPKAKEDEAEVPKRHDKWRNEKGK